MLRGFATINYWADDLAAAKRWYADLLGVEPYFERSGPDGRLAYAEFRCCRWAPRNTFPSRTRGTRGL